MPFRKTLLAILCLLFLFALPQVLSYAAGMSDRSSDWSSARRDPTGLSPAPEKAREAIVQVFAARTFGWRGNFAVHSWIAIKKPGAVSYNRYDVIGWRAYRGGSALVSRNGSPDNYWFGNTPDVLVDIRGKTAESLIPKIEKAISAYPYQSEYRLWPGPNSNTFVAYVGRSVPELELDLPPTAIGKDFLMDGKYIDTPVSGQGFQLSIMGAGGFVVSPVEGFELHLLGFTTGIDFDDATLKIPGFGRVPLL